jgi:hypothetical protein
MHRLWKQNTKEMSLSTSLAFNAFCNSWTFFIKHLASAVWTLHPDVFNIELDCFFAQPTFIAGHCDSSFSGVSTGIAFRARSAAIPAGVAGKYAPPAKILPHFEHVQMLVLVRCTVF